MPDNKREKEDQHRAGKSPREAKFNICKKIKIIEVSYSLYCCNKPLHNVCQALLYLFIYLLNIVLSP